MMPEAPKKGKRICVVCGAEFKTARRGRRKLCSRKECTAKRNSWLQREHYLKHIEKRRESARTRMAEFRRKNPQKVRDRQRRWYWRDIEKRRSKRREYCLKNWERVRSTKIRSYLKHAEKIKASVRRRRMIKKQTRNLFQLLALGSQIKPSTKEQNESSIS